MAKFADPLKLTIEGRATWKWRTMLKKCTYTCETLVTICLSDARHMQKSGNEKSVLTRTKKITNGRNSNRQKNNYSIVQCCTIPLEEYIRLFLCCRMREVHLTHVGNHWKAEVVDGCERFIDRVNVQRWRSGEAKVRSPVAT